MTLSYFYENNYFEKNVMGLELLETTSYLLCQSVNLSLAAPLPGDVLQPW